MSEPRPSLSELTLDIEQLRAWFEKMIAALRFGELITLVLALIVRMRDANTDLRQQFATSKHKQPRSEVLARVKNQLAFAFAVTPKPVEEKPPEPPPKPDGRKNQPPGSRRGRHPGRAALPAHLERIPVPNPVPAAMRVCPRCGSEMKTMGHSICEFLEVIPARIVVMQRLDERVACPHDDAIVSAPTPPQLIERGKLGTKLIVESLADKYIEHLPVERQCLRWNRAGVDIAPQTLGRGIGAALDLLLPVAKLINDKTRGPGLLATDASCIPVLDTDAEDGIRNGTMWCWANGCWVSFVFSPNGNSESVRQFLGEDLARAVQCDGTSITTFIERAGGTRPGCWSHGRRRLVEAARGGDRLALDGLEIIGRLFAVERRAAAAKDTSEQRLARRNESSRSIVDEIRAWVDTHRGAIPPKTTMGRALGYLERQWKRLILFLEDGDIELTNNRVERELRKLVLGRRNWLFTWNDLGGERTATVLTIVATCIAHGISPRAFLHQVVKLLVEGWPQDRLGEILPDRIVEMHPALRIRPPQALLAAATPALPAPA